MSCSSVTLCLTWHSKIILAYAESVNLWSQFPINPQIPLRLERIPRGWEPPCCILYCSPYCCMWSIFKRIEDRLTDWSLANYSYWARLLSGTTKLASWRLCFCWFCGSVTTVVGHPAAATRAPWSSSTSRVSCPPATLWRSSSLSVSAWRQASRYATLPRRRRRP